MLHLSLTMCEQVKFYVNYILILVALSYENMLNRFYEFSEYS